MTERRGVPSLYAAGMITTTPHRFLGMTERHGLSRLRVSVLMRSAMVRGRPRAVRHHEKGTAIGDGAFYHFSGFGEPPGARPGCSWAGRRAGRSGAQ
jgi:hypothetical protein